MKDQGPRWIDYLGTDGHSGRIPVEQVEMITTQASGDRGTIHTTSGDIIHVVNATEVLVGWRQASEEQIAVH